MDYAIICAPLEIQELAVSAASIFQTASNPLPNTMTANRTLIISVFIVASCGLAYELIIAALASYLWATAFCSFPPSSDFTFSRWA